MLAAGGFAAGRRRQRCRAPPALRWLVVHVPGAGLLRDGQKFLIPYALLLAVCLALGAERLAGRLPAPGRSLVGGRRCCPLVLLPDLAFGARRPAAAGALPGRLGRGGRSRWPSAPGEVLSLPFDGYRATPWNAAWWCWIRHRATCAAPVLVDDTLRVGDRDRRRGEPAGAARSVGGWRPGEPVADPAIRWVVVQHGVGGEVPTTSLAGLEVVHQGRDLTLYANPAAGPRPPPRPARTWPLAAHLLAAGAGRDRLLFLTPPESATPW